MNLVNTLLSQQTLIVDDLRNCLRVVTWKEKIWRWIDRDMAQVQDQNTENYLINFLENHDKDKETMDALSKFLKRVYKVKGAFQRLDERLFAAKCRMQFPVLRVEDLINPSSQGLSDLGRFIKANFMHYVIPKANEPHKQTALLIHNGEVFIRAKEGKSFLDTKEHVESILKFLPADHPDKARLTSLREDLQNENHENNIHKLCESLSASGYTYVRLSDLKLDDKGVLISQSYLADGIENFHQSEWEKLSANFREGQTTPQYQLRIVTRLPAYSFQKTRWQRIIAFIKSLFDLMSHGHSWVELVEPVYDSNKQFTGQQNVSCVGYFLLRRFKSADPMAYMPIPDNEKFIKIVNIDEQQYKKAKEYIEEVQKLVLSPQGDLASEPDKSEFNDKDHRNIRYLYKSTLKGSCVSFCSALETVVTGEEIDYRGCVRKFFFPKKHRLEKPLDRVIEKIPIFRTIVHKLRLLMRMELPCDVPRSPTFVDDGAEKG